MTRARDIADAARFINTLDGVAATLEGVELNLLDGVTATTAELNILDGVTATAVELNYVDGVTSAVQTQLNTATTAINTKSPTASPTFTGAVNASETLQIGGVAITSTPAELNLLDGVTATATELNYLVGVTSDLQAQITAAAASGGGGGGDVADYATKTSFTSNGEYLAGTESKTNHVWYKTLYIGDDADVTVSDTMAGFGDTSAAAAAADAATADVSRSYGELAYLGQAF